jgi:hypothetical protein
MTDEPFTLKPARFLATDEPWDPSKLPPRRYRDGKPIESRQTPDEPRTSHLDTVWWLGKQWAVTSYGIEQLDGTYVIEAHRLAEGLEREHPHGWPAQVTGKTWCDPDDFCTAWLVAIVLHGAKVSPMQAKMAVSRSILRDPKK